MDVHALSEKIFFLRFAVALLLGVFIGLEREWRVRQAGLHTTAMVAGGAALFAMIAPLLEVKGTDPTRVAAQVVSGIGFLAGGVILRQGATVRGLTTAATLWATSAVGVLAGFGFLREAAEAAVSIVAANLLLYPVTLAVDSIKRDTVLISTSYFINIACSSEAESAVRERIVAATEDSRLNLQSIDTSSASETSVIVRAVLVRQGRNDRKIEETVNSVKLLPGVFGANWQAAAES